jgi:hypothetical protein
MTPGFIPFWIPDSDTAPDEARAFCKSRGLSSEEARIIRRTIYGETRICVEIKKPSVLRLTSKET